MKTRGRERIGVPMIEEIDELAAALRECREYTLAMYGHLAPAQREVPLLDIVNPPLWELAHIGFFQEFFCRRWRPDDPTGSRSPSRMPGADALFDSRVVPHDDRWRLAYPSWEAMLDYLDATLEETLALLRDSRPGERFPFRLSLFHEDMHGEALLMTLQTLALPSPVRSHRTRELPAVPLEDIAFDGGVFRQGARPGDGEHAFDNEKWGHDVPVEPFAMASRPVTNGEFRAFVEDRGYARREWWTPEGWTWREGAAATAPRQWRMDGPRWIECWFDAYRPLEDGHTLVHVNRHEAEAWCRWAGRRLPTESEWEFAATNGGADRLPWGAGPPAESPCLDFLDASPGPAFADASRSGLAQLVGGVWEWTATAFGPYPGFEKDAYAEYSEPWFGDHAVLRGGSFATRSRLVHGRWRNFYRPERRDVFAGFRTCAVESREAVR